MVLFLVRICTKPTIPMKSLQLTLCSFVFFAFTSNHAYAQEIDSVINIYGNQFQQEKIHIHFDKSVYNKGETIWFKAYLMAGSESSNLSKTIYTDWYDAKGKLIAHHLYPVFGSSAKGQFDIPEIYPQSILHIRAYTKWMLNFDSSFLFEKDIVVNQPNPKENTLVLPKTELYLFPEGGELVNGMNAKIAFLATNQNGIPVSVKGAIKNSKDEILDSFFTEHAGMGSFAIDKINAAENYYVSWMDENGEPGFNHLPAIKKTGAIIQVQAIKNKVMVGIQRSDPGTESLKTLYLLAHMNQQVLLKSKINLETKNAILTEINTADYPTGILQLTLFNAAWQPVAERIVFVNNHQYQFSANIKTIAKSVARREKNIIEIDVPDSAFANMSVSVTDAGLFQEKNTIISQFLLSADLKGKITDPSSYFENEEDSSKHFLDLVMLTHGWRRFKWDDIAEAKLPVINFPIDNDYIEIGGTVKGKAFRDLEVKDFITLIIAKDSSKQIVAVPIDQGGFFSKSGFLFTDTVQVFYQFKQKDLANKTRINFTSNVISANIFFITSINNSAFKQFDSAKYKREQFFIEEEKRLEKIRSTATLKDVTVHSFLKPKTALDIADEKYTQGAFSFEAKYRGDIINDPTAFTYLDIFKYMQVRVAGLNIFSAQNGTASQATYSVALRNGTPAFFLDENYLDPRSNPIGTITSIPMSEIAYIKIFYPPFVAAPGGGPNGAIVVYTRKGDEKPINYNAFAEKKLLAGYTKYKEFFSPNYSDSVKNFAPDTRATLYWNPFVLTNAKNPKVQLEFYNNDISKRLRVVLEGINADGKLTHIEKIIE